MADQTPQSGVTSPDFASLADKAFGTDNKDRPSSSGMVTPQVRKGDMLVGQTKVRLAMNVLGQALEKLGVDTDEGQTVLSAMNSLSKDFGSFVSSELVPSQILELVRGEASLQKGQPIQSATQPQQPQPPQAGAAPSNPILQQLAQQQPR